MKATGETGLSLSSDAVVSPGYSYSKTPVSTVKFRLYERRGDGAARRLLRARLISLGLSADRRATPHGSFGVRRHIEAKEPGGST